MIDFAQVNQPGQPHEGESPGYLLEMLPQLVRSLCLALKMGEAKRPNYKQSLKTPQVRSSRVARGKQFYFLSVTSSHLAIPTNSSDDMTLSCYVLTQNNPK